MTPGFAVTPEHEDSPVAVFATMEDALRWATLTFGPDSFHIAEVITMSLGTPRPEPIPA